MTFVSDSSKLRLAERMLTQALARQSMLEFCQYTKMGWQTGRHHHLLTTLADQILSGSLKRLIVSLPPRHTKSEIYSIRMIAKFLGMYPHKQVILCCTTLDLATMASKAVRDMLRGSDKYRDLFTGVALDPERQPVNDWRTIQGGGLKSTGIGGAITGRGADLLIIDDPHKEGDEMSPAALEAAFNWYASGARTRLSPGAAIAVIHTRWHPSDLIGRLLDLEAEGNGENWTVVSLPALAVDGDALGRAPGEALWPERYSREDLLRLERLSPRYFQALYQQDPQPQETKLFSADKFKPAPVNLPIDSWVWTFDLAIMDNEQADYTTWGRWHYDKQTHELIVTHLARKRQEWPATKADIQQLMRAYPFDVFVFPPQTYELMAVQELRHESPDFANRIVTIDPAKFKGDKSARASHYADVVASGRAYVEQSVMGDLFIREHDRFKDRNDDFVDMSAVAAHYYGVRHDFNVWQRNIEKPLTPMEAFYAQL